MPKILTDQGRSVELALALHDAYPSLSVGVIRDFVLKAQQAAKIAKKWSEKTCNVPMTERQENLGDRKIVRLNQSLSRLTETNFPGLKIILGGDPRGPCGAIYIPNRLGDSFGGGFALY